MVKQELFWPPDAKLLDTGVVEHVSVRVLFKRNTVTCCKGEDIDTNIIDSNVLLEVNIPYGEKYIVDRAFKRCKKLAMVTIPNSVKQIGEYASHCCSELDHTEFSDTHWELGLCMLAGLWYK